MTNHLLSLQSVSQQRIGIDRRATPPLLLRVEPHNREVQVRRRGIRIATRADMADYRAAPYALSFG
jgi:hypothetical protein